MFLNQVLGCFVPKPEIGSTVERQIFLIQLRIKE